jgi:hypothetical protein
VQHEVSALSQVLPSFLIRDALQETGRTSKRTRKLPAELTAWLVIGLALFRDLNARDVLSRVATALGSSTWRPGEEPHTTSITQARDRIGWETMRSVFRRQAERLASSTRDSWRGHEVYSLDGTTFNTPDTRENEHWFGRPGVSRGGSSAFPQLRAVMLVGVRTHVVADVAFGPYKVSENRVAEHLVARLKAGTVVLMDRGYYGFNWCVSVLRRRADFVIRMKLGEKALKPRRLRRLGKDDWLCEIPRPARARASDYPEGPVLGRTIKCRRKGLRPVWIVTSLVDPDRYPRDEVLELYRARWEGELCYRELKAHLADTNVPFRGMKPHRVLQEAYGQVIAYNCVRALMCEAAAAKEVQAIRLGFVPCLTRVRFAILGAAGTHGGHTALVAELTGCMLPPRREGRTCDRAVKVKTNPKYPRKRRDRPIGATPRRFRARSRELRRIAAA